MSNYYSNFFIELRDLSPGEVTWLRNSHAALLELESTIEDKPDHESAAWLWAQAAWDQNLSSQELSFKECEVLDTPCFEYEGSTVIIYAGNPESPSIDVVCSWLVKFLASRAPGWTVAKEIFIEWANWCDTQGLNPGLLGLLQLLGEEPEGFSGGLAIITADGYSCTYTGADQVKDLLREMHSRRATKPEAA